MMENMNSPESAIYDEVSLEQSLLFSDSLKDLKNLRSQLYSAAEYFELSYLKDEQKQIVVSTLKEYAIKALVNTVDHLGSVTYKVNSFVDEQVDEVSGTELRVSCIEQRLRTCQESIDREGFAQQSLVIDTPKYHKRYIITPAGETTNGTHQTMPKYRECSVDDVENSHQFKNVVRAKIRETPPSTLRKGRSPSPSPQPGSFLFTGSMSKKEPEKRASSPHRFPIMRYASLAARPATPHYSARAPTPEASRPNVPNPSAAKWVSKNTYPTSYPPELRKSASLIVRSDPKEIEQHESKSKRLLKSLLSRRKSKKDEMLYTYLDEY